MMYKPTSATPPGKILLKNIERLSITQKSLSERTGLSEKHISQIINNEASITVETALLLENAIGGTASFWINLEKNFQETSARIEKDKGLSNEASLLSHFPYLELAKRGYVDPTSNNTKKVENLWKFFGVNSLESVALTEKVEFRKKADSDLKKEHIATWLRCGEIEFQKSAPVSEYSESDLKNLVNSIRPLTQDNPRSFSVKLRDLLSSVGVGIVYTPHFSGAGVSGAVRWIGNNPIIQLSLYGSYADIFWFNVYHEIAHILLHGKKDKFIEFDDRTLSLVQEKEKEADEFASSYLLSDEEYTRFLSLGNYSLISILNFSRSIKIHPGILAGRLCHKKILNWNEVAKLRTRLKFQS